MSIDNKKLNQFETKANIASSAQKIFEEIFFKIVQQSLRYYRSKNLVLSGGCAMNCLANGKLSSQNIYKNIFVPYCPGDNGGAIVLHYYLIIKSYPQKFSKSLSRLEK